MGLSRDDLPGLASKARLVRDRTSGRDVLLYPERGLGLNAVAAAVVRRLDGTRTVAAVAAEVAAELIDAPAAEVERDVLDFLEELAKRGLIDVASVVAPAPRPPRAPSPGHAREQLAPDHPYTLIAELTYRCPLRCPYCSNPVELAAAAGELYNRRLVPRLRRGRRARRDAGAPHRRRAAGAARSSRRSSRAPARSASTPT